MVNPQTVNVGIIVPLTGADVDVWGEDDVNPNMVAIDGLIAGVQTVTLSSVPVTLTSPSGFTATPSAGPTQSQNRVLKFTGTLSADVLVTLPLPGVYVIDYGVTVASFVTQLRAVGAGEIIALPPGTICTIYCDGTNVRFVDLGKPGDQEFWTGLSSMPRWVTSCTKAPYLICSGSTLYNFSDFPYLGVRMGSAFGGNGITTFGVPDLAGRVPLAYDSTGTRVTTALCGINGQTMGAAGGICGENLTRAHLPNSTVTVTVVDPGHTHPVSGVALLAAASTNGGGGGGFYGSVSSAAGTNTAISSTGITASFPLNGGVTQTVLSNMQPAQVAGLWVIKT